MSQPTRIAILGAAGRMGRALIQSLASEPGLKLGAALDHPSSPELGRDAAALAGLEPAGVAISADLQAALPAFDVLVDFTRPEGTVQALAVCAGAGKAMVIGT